MGGAHTRAHAHARRENALGLAGDRAPRTPAAAPPSVCVCSSADMHVQCGVSRQSAVATRRVTRAHGHTRASLTSFIKNSAPTSAIGQGARGESAMCTMRAAARLSTGSRTSRDDRRSDAARGTRGTRERERVAVTVGVAIEIAAYARGQPAGYTR